MTAAGSRQHAAVLGHELHELEDVEDGAVVGEDRLPGDRADQVGGEEGCHHREQQEQLVLPGPQRDRVRERVGDQQRDQGRDRRVDERAHQLLGVARERVGVVRDLERRREARGERDALVEGQRPHEVHGDDEEQGQPDAPGQQQPVRGQAPAEAHRLTDSLSAGTVPFPLRLARDDVLEGRGDLLDVGVVAGRVGLGGAVRRELVRREHQLVVGQRREAPCRRP